MKQLPMTNGGFALVDDEVFEWAQHSNWYKIPSRDNRTHYAERKARQADGSYKGERLHRLILGLCHGDGMEGDHKDGDGMNNTGQNLRVATRVQNTQNRGPNTGNPTRYRGVTRRNGHYRVIYGYNRAHYRFGHYKNRHEAAYAFNVAASHFDAEFARPNVIADEDIPSPERAKEITEAVMCILAGNQRLEIQVNSATGYRGVTAAPRGQRKFVARICLGKQGEKYKNAVLGQYNTTHKAAHAFNVAASILWPNKVTANKIPSGEISDHECTQIELKVRSKINGYARLRLSA